MKFLCTKGLFYFSLALVVVAAVACTQSKPQVPTPTLVPLANETIVVPAETLAAPTSGVVDNATLVPPPSGNETPLAPPAEQTPGADVTPIIVEPTLLPTPTTAGDTGQPVATPVPGSQQGAPGSCTSPYTVQAGEWFYAIARKCGVTPQALLAANPGMNPNVLRPGQTLNMPGGGGGAPPPSQGGQPPAQGGGGGSCSNPYIVQSGDTLFSIARRCGSTVDAIQAANNLPSPEYIFPGQALQIP